MNTLLSAPPQWLIGTVTFLGVLSLLLSAYYWYEFLRDWWPNRNQMGEFLPIGDVLDYMIKESRWGFQQTSSMMAWAAERELAKQAANGNISLYGIADNETSRALIPSDFWLSNGLQNPFSDKTRTEPKTLAAMGGIVYSDLYVKRTDMLKTWPSASRIYKWWKS